MTHIVGIKMRNWMRYRGEFKLALGPGCYAILAEGEGNKKRSNYFGKSSFIAAPRWALEGKMVGDVDTLDELISRGEDGLEVRVDLSEGSSILRKKDRGSSASLVVKTGGRELKGDEAQAAIERLVGLSKEDRLSTCWSEQEDLSRPIKSTSSVLTRTIEKWLGEELEKLVEAGEYASLELKTASDLHAKAVGWSSELERAASDETIASLEAEVGERSRQVIGQRKIYDTIQKEREEFSSRKEHRELIKRANELRQEFKTVSPSRRKDADGEQEALRLANEKVHLLRSEVAGLEETCAKIQKLVRGEFDGACPVSKGFKCPATIQINALQEPNRKELDKVQSLLRKKQKELEGARGAWSIKHAEHQEALADVAAGIREQARREGIQKQIEEIGMALRDYVKRGVKPAEDGEIIPQAVEPPNDYELRRSQELLANAKKAKGLLQDARRRVEDTANDVRACRLSLSILGPEGARRRVLESTVARIEKKANRMLAEAGIELKVKAVWGRQVGVLADQCPECGRAYPASAKVKRCECGALRGQKVNNEFKWKLNHVSGAAWNMGGLVIRCAGFEYLKERRGAPWSVAMLDEISGSLDEHHRRSISASIRRLLVGTFEQAFITAHDTSSLEACDKKIIVTGGQEWSIIRVVS